MSQLREKAAKIREWFPTVDHFWLFLRIAGWSAVLPLLLRTFSLPRLMFIITPQPVSPPPREQALVLSEKIDQYIAKILRENPDNRGRLCLRRSLLLFRFLRQIGLPAHFYVGVKKNGGHLLGHSWIELFGERYKDSQAGVEYHVTFSCDGEEV